MADDLNDVRGIQRILASREGQTAFWLVRGEERLPLRDLSIGGFSLAGEHAIERGARMAFRLVSEAMPGEEVSGEAEMVNQFGGEAPRTGFRIVSFEGNGRHRLHAWLAAHVIACASVPISKEDAAAVVAGRSIV